MCGCCVHTLGICEISNKNRQQSTQRWHRMPMCRREKLVIVSVYRCRPSLRSSARLRLARALYTPLEEIACSVPPNKKSLPWTNDILIDVSIKMTQRTCGIYIGMVAPLAAVRRFRGGGRARRAGDAGRAGRTSRTGRTGRACRATDTPG
ncbi:unnamed protein product [Chrysodeixis includens]|uniref:Uncharacterized protein n=1 Tax=Chrysodeixis includens TaxID=689277 RepID=A0A9N8PZA0_CHRIL|nr:unnamed protein product [Chrysodeixis includens]